MSPLLLWLFFLPSFLGQFQLLHLSDQFAYFSPCHYGACPFLFLETLRTIRFSVFKFTLKMALDPTISIWIERWSIVPQAFCSTELCQSTDYYILSPLLYRYETRIDTACGSFISHRISRFTLSKNYSKYKKYKSLDCFLYLTLIGKFLTCFFSLPFLKPEMVHTFQKTLQDKQYSVGWKCEEVATILTNQIHLWLWHPAWDRTELYQTSNMKLEAWYRNTLPSLLLEKVLHYPLFVVWGRYTSASFNPWSHSNAYLV